MFGVCVCVSSDSVGCLFKCCLITCVCVADLIFVFIKLTLYYCVVSSFSGKSIKSYASFIHSFITGGRVCVYLSVYAVTLPQNRVAD